MSAMGSVAPREITLNYELPECFGGLLKRARYKGFWGGRGSGKSHSVATWLVSQAVEGKIDARTKKRRGIRILCCREIQLSISDSVKTLLEDKINELGLGWYFRSTEKQIIGINGSRFFFAGLHRNVQNIKSKEKIDYVWVEEANTVTQDSLDKLIPTVREPGSELIFTWNPDSAEDPIDVLLRSEHLAAPDPALMADYDEWQIVARSTYRDNHWFPDVLRIEKDRDRQRDPGKYAHVWLGEYMVESEARVFNNWRIGTVLEINRARQHADRYYFGADFGFANDPTVLLRCFIVSRTLYIDKELVKVGLEIDDTPAYWSKITGSREWPIVADSARPETISYLNRHGYPKVKPAAKGAGSVDEGVQFLKSFDIVIHPDCENTIDEFSVYSYKVDKRTKEVLPILLDANNHCIDSARYAVEPTRRAQGGSGTLIGLH